jgi:hypothetical protein
MAGLRNWAFKHLRCTSILTVFNLPETAVVWVFGPTVRASINRIIGYPGVVWLYVSGTYCSCPDMNRFCHIYLMRSSGYVQLAVRPRTTMSWWRIVYAEWQIYLSFTGRHSTQYFLSWCSACYYHEVTLMYLQANWQALLAARRGVINSG